MEYLLKQRATSRGWLTRASKALNEVLLKSDVSDTELDVAFSEFNTRLQNVDNIQAKIELEIEESDIEHFIDEAFNFRQGHLDIKIKAETMRRQILKDNRDTRPLDTCDSDKTSNGKSLGYARLPKLELPKFDGNYLEFTSFYDKFLAVVDGSDLPTVTKFTYLQSLLTGEALASIKGLSVTEGSYPVAKEILTKRYGRKERIIFAHIQQLLALQGDFRKSKGLWDLYDSLQTHVRCLETLGVSGDTYGVILAPLVLSRIPTEIRLEWAREGEGKESDLTFLLDFLYKEIKRRERSQTFQKDKEEEKRVKRAPEPSVAAFHAKSEGPNNNSVYCNFCQKQGHTSAGCNSLKQMTKDEIREKLKQCKLCSNCFGKHPLKKCPSRRNCRFCNGRHHSLLCRNQVSQTAVNDQSSNPKESGAVGGTVNYAHFKDGSRATVMQVVRAAVETTTGGALEVNVLFDGGSDRSFITQSMAQKLQLRKCGEETFAFSGFAGAGAGPRTKRKIYGIELGGVGVELVEIPTICSDMFRSPIPRDILNQFSVPFSEDLNVGRTVKIDILIGLDFYWKLVTCEMTRVDSLVAQKTHLGWMLSGEYPGHTDANGVQLLCLGNIPEPLVRSFWELDAIGILDASKDSEESSKVVEQFHDTVSYENGRYSVALPWKAALKGDLLNNKSQAEKRLRSLSRRLAAKPELQDSYNRVLSEMEDSGVIKEVSTDREPSGPVFYLPHRPVVKAESKTTKVRPVFDASAKGFNGISLNDCLETGPNLLPNLLEILLRFRRWKIAVTGDITKAFLQIRVKGEDQDVLRFLWEQDGKTKVMVFDRVPFGTKSSPFLLNATIKHHLQKYPEDRVVTELKTNMYVDDFLSGADTEEEACHLVARAKQILSEAGMDLTKWSSSSMSVADTLLKEFDPRFDAVDTTKVLGLKWIPTEDCFSFHGIKIPENLEATKRVVLSFIARLFDPLGFFTPFTIAAKILFQELWGQGVDWDSKLSESFSHPFGRWLREIEDLQSWKIPRCLAALSWGDADDIQIHVFCDASEKAYGCCAYLRVKEGDKVKVSLALAKARVAPLKRITLPRLELLAAVLGSRMVRFVQDSFKLSTDTVYRCYTDSMITLGWIQSESKRWKTFVANRVQEIQDLTDPSCWCHCAGRENPADMLTRGMTANQLMTSSLWLGGPEWLSDEISPSVSQEPTELDNEEAKLEERKSTQCIALESKPTDSVFHVMKWSSLQKAMRIMGWVLRFLDRCSKKRVELTPQLTNDELLSAHERLIRLTQWEFFGEEIKGLQADTPVGKTSPLHRLSPFLGEDGLLRASCRLNYSNLSYEEKFPIILPKCHLTLLMVRDAHTKFKHAGVNQMISILRNNFWIIGLRTLAKKIKGECLACKYIDAKACQEPIAPVMEARLKQAPPFSIVGMDYAGPVYCRDFPDKKFYVLLFTCALIRAIHLELVESLSLSHFLLAFRKFVARRGMPATIYSDNAKTFKSASSALFKLYGSHSPKWKYSVPRAPWWGGWWERMIGNMKLALKKAVGIRCLGKSELETTLAEVEACINARPLTFVGDSIENGHPLTPSHFLLGRGNHLDQVSDEPSLKVTAENLKDLDRLIESRLAIFWKRWQDEYLKQLPFPKWRGKYGNVGVGSVVLIREDNCTRLHWPMGVVTELIEGRDGVVRSVKVKTKNGTFLRPIQRIHDLELNRHPIVSEPEKENVSQYGRVSRPPVRYQ